MKVTRTQMIILGAALLVVAGTATLLRPRPLEVETGRVTRTAMETTVDADGRTRVRERYVITAPVSGRVRRIGLVEGSPVRAGQVVAWIAPMPMDEPSTAQARSRLDGAKALASEADTRVRLAAASLVQRRREVTRAQRVFDAGGLAPRDLEEAQLSLRAAEEDVNAATQRSRAAEADVRQAQAALMTLGDGGTTEVAVRAPAAGSVLRIPERSERVAAAGTPLLEIGDPRTLEVVVDVLSSDGAAIAPGDPVHLERWGGGNGDAPALEGCVRSVEPAAFTKVSALGVDEQRVNVLVDITDPPATVGDGFRVEARIVIWKSPGALTAPMSALVRQGKEWTVFVVENDRAHVRTVRLGRQNAVSGEVVAGLREGDAVVLFPSDAVVDGVRVKARVR